jgi:hypothetical protein
LAYGALERENMEFTPMATMMANLGKVKPELGREREKRKRGGDGVFLD